ncbi:MAG: hypothetical protein KUG77_29125, partial [Nannocystaceae bacterium]|nr:hypothetical protein [Nannocystaceae bacterium]
MNDEVYLPRGLMRCPIDVGTKPRRRTEFFYLINLGELTNAVVEGKPAVGPSDTSGTRDFWTDLEITRLVQNLGASAVGEMDEEDKLELVDATLSLLKDTALNDLAWQFARSETEPVGWKSELINPDSGEFLGVTILHIAESIFRSRSLKKRYVDLISRRKYKAIRESAYYFEQLAEFDRKKLRPLKQRQAELDESLATVKRMTSRVANAHMGVVAMIHAAEDKGVRTKLWGTTHPVETSSLFFEEQMVPRLPVGNERDNAAYVRDKYLPDLYRDLAELMAWMASGSEYKGHEFLDAKLRNNYAADLLEALRENEDLHQILENHVYVNRLLWRRVERVLL